MKSNGLQSVRLVFAVASVLGLLGVVTGPAAEAVTINWVTVGAPGNDPDDTDYGAVAYTYGISETAVTNAQYAEFLNAVADSDAYGLYNEYMDLDMYPTEYGGITRSGSSGSYTYSAITGRESMPVIFVSFWDALRFANWLHNGQPEGAQNSSTTEDGAYTITAAGITANSITRNLGVATIVLPSEDEWYKAAYFNGTSYFDYPAGMDTQSTCATPGATANTANCDSAVGDLTDVGSYTDSASPNGTFDQGGNVYEWTETIYSDSWRIRRGGNFIGSPDSLAVTYRTLAGPTSEGFQAGFRVAMIPEPSTGLLLATGLAGLAAARRQRSFH